MSGRRSAPPTAAPAAAAAWWWCGGAEGGEFGSVARGLDRPGSDLDLLVDLEQGHSLLEVIALQQELESQLNCRVDLAEPDQLHPTIGIQVIAEARPL
ncbi:nucleotidyltransferase family protein [Synechococcus sp. Lug-A]|uniref:nucleotidyltransferase family protein n=1 Tax=Synechococcus sp. Lug-A TaxID=2823740 RepID=UPI0020CFDE57|nr:nucleotidyltransferase domain-containing protein [Synechococcus sp. Lug-A]